MQKEYDVFGIGNPLVDILTHVDDDFLRTFNLNKGIMHLIEENQRTKLLSQISKSTIAPGGSCANTIISLGSFGVKSVYAGAIGNDQFGDTFELQTIEAGSQSSLSRKQYPTGSSIILITPDAERTQNTFLGACQLYTKNDVDVEKLSKSNIFYFTGYMWDTPGQKEAIEYAIDIAKKNDVQIFFDVADPFAVNRSRDDFNRIMADSVNFVFANFEEAKMLSGEEDQDKVMAYMRATTPRGVVKLGKNGSIVYDEQNQYEIPVYDVNAIDTTGAGDIYAAGMIYGIINGFDLEKSGMIASYLGARVVEQIGARLDHSIRTILENFNFDSYPDSKME